jgi:hypothetical protein
MITFSKLTKQDSKLNRFLTTRFGRPVHMAVECTLLNKVRKFSDGVDVFNLYLNVDFYRGDHTPRKTFVLTLLNVNIIELCLYNTYHYYDGDE